MSSHSRVVSKRYFKGGPEIPRRLHWRSAMTCHRSLPGLAGKRLKAIRPSNSGPESRGNLLRFPTGQHFEAVISGLGEGRHDRTATANRTAYRKRVPGIVVLFRPLLLISRVSAAMIAWDFNPPQPSTFSPEATTLSPRPH